MPGDRLPMESTTAVERVGAQLPVTTPNRAAHRAVRRSPMKTASRLHGLLLMGTGALVFLGTSAQWLPAEAFFPAVAVCLLGLVVFMKGNRKATELADQRLRRALDPDIRNQTAERFATRQADVDGRSLGSISERGVPGGAAPKSRRPVAQVDRDEIVLDEVEASGRKPGQEADFVVTTDVSFPVELQESRSLAEQLEKLQRLCEDGVITVEEFSIAKAKLLR
jgi:hypothetical protein